MNPRLFFMQGKMRTFPINTIIGGIAASISTKALLATKLGISESEIRRFEIVGSDVQANIRSDYAITNTAFSDVTALNDFQDIESKVNNIGSNAFFNTGLISINFQNVIQIIGTGSISSNANLVSVDLPNLKIFGNQTFKSNSALKTLKLASLETIPAKLNCFQNLPSAELIQMRKLKYYGDPNNGNGATASGFSSLKTGCVIEVNIFLKTATTSRGADLALVYAKNTRGATINFYNDDGSFNSTL